MAKILSFNYYDIGGTFSKSNTTLLKYPYLYTLNGSQQLHRLNVISKQSELIATIDISKVFTIYSSSDVINMYGACTSVGTDKLYFIAYGRTGDYTLSYYLCELDVDTFTCRSIRRVFSYSDLYFSSTAYGCNCKVEKLDDTTIRTYNYYSYMRASAGSTGSRYVYYDVYDVNLDTLSATSKFTENKSSGESSSMSYQVAGINPSIIHPTNYKQLLYGGYTQWGSYFTKVGFTGVTAPTTANTLNSGQYRYVGLFELDGKYYGIGGSLGGVANTDIIQINPNSLASVKVGESANNVTSNPAIQSTENAVYIIFSSTLMGVAELVEYSIDYTFKDNDGNTLAELTDKLPVRAVNVSSAGNDVTVTLTYIDSTTDTVFYTLPPRDNVKFFGLSDTPNSKRAMLVEGDNSVSIYNDITFYPVYIRYVVPSTTFNIELYQNSAEVNRVDKGQHLAPVGSLVGALREECSMLTPSIVYQSENVPTFNYVYIPIFNRYYFVTSLSSVSKNVWRMELNCDVLMTYKNEILLLQGVVGRQEIDFNPLLVDNELPTQNNPIVEVIDIPSDAFNTQASTEHNFLLTVIGA